MAVVSRRMRRLALLAPYMSAAVSPVEKVLEILQHMHSEGVEEKNTEQVEAATFEQKCEGTQSALSEEISEAKDKIEEQDAKIGKANAEIGDLTNEIAELAEGIENDGHDLNAAQTIRDSEKADFDNTSKDYSESLSALQRAKDLLKSKSVTSAPTETLQVSLLQIGSTSRASAMLATRAVAKFLSEEEGSPQGEAYGQQSALGGVISMLQQLEEKFKGQISALTKEETAAVFAYQKLHAGLTQKMKDDQQTTKRKQQKKGEAEESKGLAEGEKGALVQDLTATQKQLKETVTDCKMNVRLYAKQDALRGEELEAITLAMNILGGDKVSGSAKKHLYHQEKEEEKGSSFLQLGSTVARSALAAGEPQGDLVDAELVKDKMVSLLTQQSDSLNSKVLSALALRVEAGPFTKVLEMVRQLISALKKESKEEAEKHGKCEAMKNEQKLDVEDKMDQVDDVTQQYEQLSARKETLKEEIGQLIKEIRFLSGDRDAATKQRAQDKKENEQAMKEAQEGQKAVADAVAVLNEFYAKAAESAKEDEGKETATEVYGGQGEKANGIVSMLETVESDFARVESERTQAESQQSSEYTKLMNSSEVTVAVKKTEKVQKSKQLAAAKKDFSSVKEELAGAKEGLQAAQAQLEATVKQCSGEISFEERMEKRQAEIESCEQALEVLKNSGV